MKPLDREAGDRDSEERESNRDGGRTCAVRRTRFHGRAGSPGTLSEKVVNLSLPDAPVITGTSKEVFDHYGLNAEEIAAKVREILDSSEGIDNERKTGKRRYRNPMDCSRRDRTGRRVISSGSTRARRNESDPVDDFGRLLIRTDLSHRQIISEKGWFPTIRREIYANTIRVVVETLEKRRSQPNRLPASGSAINARRV